MDRDNYVRCSFCGGFGHFGALRIEYYTFQSLEGQGDRHKLAKLRNDRGRPIVEVTMKVSVVVAFAFFLSCSLGCKKPKRTTDDNGIQYGAEAEDLMAHMKDLRKATKAGDTKTASSLTMLLLPDDDDLHMALRKGADDEFKKIAELHRHFIPKTDFAAANMFGDRPEQAEIQIHGLTTEKLAQDSKSATHKEFPDSIARLARKVLRPKMTYYEVEFLEPGQKVGTKYHLFFHNGKNWKMLGPIWRVL